MWTPVYQSGADGWELVAWYREGGGAASVNVTWDGVGDERLHPWAFGSICYTHPPSAAVIDATDRGVHFRAPIDSRTVHSEHLSGGKQR